MNSTEPASRTEHFVTLFDNNFLPIGLCLHASLIRHAQPFHLWILCMDEQVEQNLRRLALPHVSLIPLREAENERLLAVKATRSRGEYCWTLTPFTAQFVFDRDADVERVTYLDADVFFFASPKLLLDEFAQSAKHVLITEHAYDPKYARFGRARRGGRFCVQFVTFRRTAEATKVMRWWQERCLEWCYARVEDGKYGDQKYLDEWPVLFGSEVHITAQKQKTLAPWNVAYYSRLGGGRVAPVFYHFHGFRILSHRELLLYSGYRIGEPGERLYEIFVAELGQMIGMMQRAGMAIPCMPRINGMLGKLAILKRQWLDGERRIPYRIVDKTSSDVCLSKQAECNKVEGGKRLRGIIRQSSPDRPLITVVTVVFNGAATLENALRSVKEQTYANIEHIVIDGGSSDGTREILTRYDAEIDYWLSEQDSGIYDAMNKGMALAHGDYIGTLNADDYFATPDVLEKIARRFVERKVDAVFSCLDIVNPKKPDRILRKYRVSRFTPFMLRIGVMPAHPTFYCRRQCYEEIGLFRTDYRIAGDFEMMVRLLLKQRISWEFADFTSVKMRAGGISSRSIKSRWLLNREIVRACNENGLYTNQFMLALKLPVRLLEYL